MKLDVTCMRYLGKDHYRMLTAIEMGMRNHELVPVELIISIARLRHGGAYKILSTLLRYKLLHHENQQFNGYRLSYAGYDILALRTLLARNVIAQMGSQIGVGKESDIFEALDEHGNELVLKIHRLGRTSFRDVRSKRDYMVGKGKANWLYMSRLAALKEFAFMQALYAHGFPTPIPIEHNRHVVAMSKVTGFPMAQIKSGNMEGAEIVFNASLDILKRLAQCGLVHCDFNEFNLMVDEQYQVTLIDFPQMVSSNHMNASELFDRDLKGLIKFFAMKMKYIPPEEAMNLKLEDIAIVEANIDMDVQASGYGVSVEENETLMTFMKRNEVEKSSDDDDEEVEGEDEDEGEKEGVDHENAMNKEAGEGDNVFGDGLNWGAEKDDGSASEGDEDDAGEGEQDREAGNDEDEALSDLDDDEDYGDILAQDDKPVLLTGEALQRAREEARFKVGNKKKGGGHRQNQNSGSKRANNTKKVNKYGRKVHQMKVDFL